MIELGQQPRRQRFSKAKIKCLDGHIVDSISEMIIDNWLFQHKIEHEKNYKYPEGKYTCDFYLKEDKIWLEYFGLWDHSEYQKSMEEKRQMCEKYNLKLIEIYPKDLYPEFNVGNKLPFFVF